MKVAVVGAHGRMQPANALHATLIAVLGQEAEIACPQAPSGQWYPYRFNVSVERNEPELSESLARLDAAVEACMAKGYARDEIVVVGFSQGAALAAEYFGRSMSPPAAAVVWTGSRVGADPLLWNVAPSLAGKRVGITGGRGDRYVPVEQVRQTALHFERRGARVNLVVHEDDDHAIRPGDHEVLRSIAAAYQQSCRTN